MKEFQKKLTDSKNDSFYSLSISLVGQELKELEKFFCFYLNISVSFVF